LLTEPRISVIVRFKNEMRYLEAVLRAVRTQRCRFPVEIVGVDNASSDGSRQIAKEYADKVLLIDEYRPGLALNAAIGASTGDYLVCLSAHAIPHSDGWLEELTAHLRNRDALGIYGAQVYPAESLFLDKRDLDIFSADRARTEPQDSDFWNANSAFRRDDWRAQRFDESVIELEDHHWTKMILPDGTRWVRFEPTAVVYHYGHEKRNDRVFLPRNDASPHALVRESSRVLETTGLPWPARMSAGLTLGSLDKLPGIHDAVPAIGRTLIEDPDFDVRWRMAGALGRIGGEQAVPFLVRGLADSSFYVRDECAWSLARLGPATDVKLLAAVPGLDEHVLPFAGLALGLGGGPDARQRGVDLLRAGVSSGDVGIERDSVYFLGELSPATVPRDVLAVVERRLDGARPVDLVRAAAWCWGRLAGIGPHGGTAAVRSLARLHPSELVREEAVIALWRTGGGQLPEEVAAAMVADGTGRVRFAAAQCARAAAEQDPEAVKVLQDLPADPDFGVEFERACVVGERVRY
jgi:Glycosyl transferase family 2/HEAT repeats